MPTKEDYLQFVCSQIERLGYVRYKKMFGEGMIFLNEKPIFLVCNSTVHVKMLPEMKELMEGAETAFPYKGAKEHYILDIENKELACEVAQTLERVLPLPKPKKPKVK
ncbi:MAG: hypothetical protein FWD89_05060 [Firmicutes bacterium]|nr:hypothetical protein [Bacillota bacterium]MCL2771652.1 hypothetical protein [Bacillota bacterium]